MTKTKNSWFSRSLASLLALLMCLSMISITAFATASDGHDIIKLDIPVADGVYYADVEMQQAANPNRASMGNAALRGSSSYEAKQPTDTGYKSIVIVKDGKATALLEFMPMGYIGQYGFMMELESVQATRSTAYGLPDETDPNTKFIETQTLTYQKTSDGKIVYDVYNDPTSEFVFKGQTERPAGYGRPASKVNISDKPYSHLLSLDVTPVFYNYEDLENPVLPSAPADYTVENAAYCHVFVPVMFNISPNSGDQYARMSVDWTSVTKIENPETIAQYMLWSAEQIDTSSYDSDAVSTFETTVNEVKTSLENVWPSQRLSMQSSDFNAQPTLDFKRYTAAEDAAFAKKIDTAIKKLTAPSIDTSKLQEAIDKGNAADTLSASLINTDESYAAFTAALADAKQTLADSSASQETVNAKTQALTSAITGLTPLDVDSQWSKLYAAASAFNEYDYTEATWSTFSTTWKDLKDLKFSSQSDFFKTMYLSRFKKAVDALENEPTLDADPMSLEDGKYTLKAEMLKINRSEYSMSNNAINHNVWLEVEDGQYYLTVQFVGLAIYNRFGYLSNLSYYEDGYSYDDNGSPVGTTINTEVLCTQVDFLGNSVVDEFNDADHPYPSQVKIPIVNLEDAVDEYVPLQVFVPIMESITPGLGTQPVLMKLDWSALRNDTGRVQPMDPPVQSDPVDFTDTTTGVRVTAEKGVLDAGSNITVKKIESDAAYEEIKSALSGIGEKFDAYEVFFTDHNGDAVAPNGRITVYIPVPDGTDSTKLAMYRMNYESEHIGPKTLLSSAVVNDGKMSVPIIPKTTQIRFAVVEKGSVLVTAADYSGVDTAIANIPVDLSAFTDESVKVLNDAKQAVDRTLNSDRQTEVDAMAKAINDAITNLKYKTANYTAVNEAIAAANALTADNYKDFSAVTSAVNSVVEGKNITEQASVDAMAKAIQDAINGLEYKDADYSAVDTAIAEANKLNAADYKDFTAVTSAVGSVVRDKNITEQAAVDAMAKAIQDAINGLTYKDADYSAVDTAIADVNKLNAADYKDFTKVTSAVDAVVRGKNITEQAAVDAMAKAINDAIGDLEKIGELDKNKLTDGIYSVYGEMIKVNRIDKSMSNEAINHYIKLTVKDGKYSLTMDFHGLAYLNRFGYLAELSYYQNGYSFGQYGTVEGTRAIAEVLSTQKNSDGSDLYDEFNQAGGSYEGKLYPDQIQFPLVSDALADKDGFVPLHVFVPVMEDISEGTGDQDVLLKLDWSTLKETTEEDPDFKPEDPVEQSPAIDFTDSKTGVKVYADKGVFEEGTKIVVTEITSGSDYNSAASSLADISKKFKLYDVKFYDANGNEVTPNGTVEISFPSDSDCAVYRMNGDGTKTLVKGSVKNGSYTVVTKTSGIYTLVEKTNTSGGNGSVNTDNTNENIPKTGNMSDLSTFALIALASGVMITVLEVNKKRKKNKGE